MSVDEITIGSTRLQPNRQLLKDGERIALGRRALEILSLLAMKRGEVVTKDELFSTVWPKTIVGENALQVHITAVRKALGEDAELLENVRGVGYLLHEGGLTDDETLSRTIEFSPLRYLPLIVVAFLLAGAAWLLFASERSGAGRPDKVLAVVPFATSGEDPAQKALAAGISAELIGRLRKMGELKVVTVSDRKGADEAVLLGTIYADNKRVRVSAVIEATDGEVIWSQIFDRNMGDLISVQEEIARAVSNALSVPLDVGIENKRSGGTNSPDAYANYIQGRVNRHNPNRSVPTAFLERALDLDPDYVKALTELTYVHGISLYSVVKQEDANNYIAIMDELSARALKVDPRSWQSHAARGWYNVLQRNFVEADKAHQRVEQMDPGNDVELLETLVNYNSQMGRSKKALETRAMKAAVDPIFSIEPLPYDHLIAGEYQRVIQSYRDRTRAFVLDQDPYHPMYLYWALRLSGREDEAKNLARSVLGDNADYKYFVSMDYDGLLRNLPYDDLSAFAQKKFGVGGRDELSHLAHFASQLGNHRLALDYLRLAYNDRDAIGGYQALWHPALAPTRRTPEFAEWITELGMDEAWRVSGDWGDYCRPLEGSKITCR